MIRTNQSKPEDATKVQMSAKLTSTTNRGTVSIRGISPSHYDPTQPRVPAGREGAGRWTSGGAGVARTNSNWRPARAPGSVKALNLHIPASLQHLRVYGDPSVNDQCRSNNLNGPSYYPDNDGIYCLSLSDDKVHSIQHEWGHHVDYALGTDVEGGRIPWSVYHSHIFEWASESAVVEIGSKSPSDPKQLLREALTITGGEMTPPFNTFADFIGALTNNVEGWGHPQRIYDHNPYARNREAFADAIALQAHPELAALVDRAAPGWYAAFQDLIRP